MIKYTEKLPLLNHRNRHSNGRNDIDDSLLLWRSNTEPLSELLKSMHRKESLMEAQKLRASEHFQPKSLQIPSGQKKQKKLSPLKLPEENSRDLLLYRKSINHLISIYQQKSKELKSLNINCYKASVSPKKVHLFNDLIAKQAQERKHRSKVLQLKKKLKKGLLRTEGNESPQQQHSISKRKNITELKKILNVNSPYSEERKISKPTDDKPANSVLLCPHQQPLQREHEPSLYSKRRAREAIVNRSKRTTIGGWKIDKIQTTYPQ